MTQTVSLDFKQRFAKKQLLQFLQTLQHGCLTVDDMVTRHQFGQQTAETHGEIIIKQATAFPAITFGGNIGLAESYIATWWQTPDLLKVLTVLAQNANQAFAFSRARPWLKKLRSYVWHRQKKNTPLQAKLNILAHYDLGNDLFKLFLDPSMMYSSAIFPTKDSSLEAAQKHRLQVICDKLQLSPQDHLLEIGSGWGALAIYAAKHIGCKVTTTTISNQQYAECQRRIAAENLQGQITLLQQDYRQLQGQYDKLVSIEMIEAVGPDYYQAFFQQCDRLLKDDGLMLIQAITTIDQRYQHALNEVDFIKRYIFPGGHLPSLSIMQQHITDSTRLNLIDLHDITPHYALTLQAWHDNFMAQLDAVKQLGFDEAFIRLWQYYFCYCQAGFATRTINVVQALYAKPAWQFSLLNRLH